MDIKTEIYLLQLAQGIVPLEKGNWWFARQSDELQVEALQVLANACVQAGASGDLAGKAIELSQLDPDFTPCELLLKAARENPLGSGGVSLALAKIVALPPDERMQSFILLIALLGIADARSRSECGDSSRHWWHQDLSNPEVVERIVGERS